MCGRFTLSKDSEQLRKTFTDLPVDPRITARYNIAPTQPVAAWVADPGVRMELFTWGLIPPWAKDPSFGVNCINARSETLLEKPTFKTPFRRKRCLIPADGWYEWKRQTGNRKQPMYFHRRDREAFAFAGLWEEWHDKEGGMILSCTIITTRPNALAKRIHPRMPVVLREEDHREWLNPNADLKTLNRMFEPIASDDFTAIPVSTKVNKAGVEGEDLIEPWSSPEYPSQGELF